MKRFYSACFPNHDPGTTIRCAVQHPGPSVWQARGTMSGTTSIPAGAGESSTFSCIDVREAHDRLCESILPLPTTLEMYAALSSWTM
jgi:hypothetical protein